MTTDRYVIKLPLVMTQRDARVANSSFEVGRLMYNAFLGECERRRKLYNSHPDYLATKELKGEEHKKTRIALYKKAERATGFYFRSAAKKHGLDNSLEQYLHQTILGSSYLCEHYGRHEATELCKRAFDASVKVARGQSKKVHFKRRGRDFITSAAGTSLNSSLTWSDGKLWWGKRLALEPQSWVWEDEKTKPVLELFAAQEAQMRQESKQRKQEAEARRVARKAGKPAGPKQFLDLTRCCIKQARLVRKLIHGEWRYFAYLVCVGKPVKKEKHHLGHGKIGLDLGPRKMGYVSEKGQGNDAVKILNFCAELEDTSRKERRLARKLDRQRRANNPDNFNEDGTAKKGCKIWKTSTRMSAVHKQLVELRRKEAEYRRCLHGRLVNVLRSLGDQVNLEGLSYKSWQKARYGKSVGRHAPGLFVQLLKTKFDFTEGMVQELNARVLRLSQRCPMCERVRKKKLSERVHKCECGFEMDRELVSALLAICVDQEGTTVQADAAKTLCQERGPLLRVAWGKTESESAGLTGLHTQEGLIG